MKARSLAGALKDIADLEEELETALDHTDYWIAEVANRGKVVQELGADREAAFERIEAKDARIAELEAELARRDASAEKYRCNNCSYFSPDFGADFCNERNSYIDYYVVSVGCAEWSEKHENV